MHQYRWEFGMQRVPGEMGPECTTTTTHDAGLLIYTYICMQTSIHAHMCVCAVMNA